MARTGDLRGSLKELGRALSDATGRLADSAQGGNVRIAREENVEMAINVGASDAARTATARQTAPITQHEKSRPGRQ